MEMEMKNEKCIINVIKKILNRILEFYFLYIDMCVNYAAPCKVYIVWRTKNKKVNNQDDKN